jgi:hypothetical protein
MDFLMNGNGIAVSGFVQRCKPSGALGRAHKKMAG